ncbi:hypothetical protein EV286_108144 [Rhizobium sp. BK251]|nr:hypothetical protein EV286_108144 [Rhizobium sp. BK251]
MALLRIFRRPRKLALIVGGIALLGGASGAFALYIGKDKILRIAAGGPNGISCTDVNLVTIRRPGQLWVRKYIKTAPTDGMTRVRTALRVARAVYDTQKPDLVQVVVLDESGPTLRSDIRGRAIGADVVYVPHPEKMVEGVSPALFTAKYFNSAATEAGLFFGERMEMPLEDIEHMNAALTDHDDCVDPVAAEAALKAPAASKAAPPAEKGSGPAEHGAPSPSSGPEISENGAEADAAPAAAAESGYASAGQEAPAESEEDLATLPKPESETN